MTDTDDKKGGWISAVFEELSRLIAAIAMGVFVYLEAHGVTVHDVAWYSAGLLLTGEKLLTSAGGVADKIIKAMDRMKK